LTGSVLAESRRHLAAFQTADQADWVKAYNDRI
jgi:hypothetical protein